jgi:hypothetical protein
LIDLVDGLNSIFFSLTWVSQMEKLLLALRTK